MRPAVHDMCLLYTPKLMVSETETKGAKCLQIDATLNIGNKKFMNLKEQEGSCFDRKTIKVLSNGNTIEFNGASIHLNDGIYSISQQFYIKQRKPISFYEDFYNVFKLKNSVSKSRSPYHRFEEKQIRKHSVLMKFKKQLEFFLFTSKSNCKLLSFNCSKHAVCARNAPEIVVHA